LRRPPWLYLNRQMCRQLFQNHPGITPTFIMEAVLPRNFLPSSFDGLSDRLDEKIPSLRRSCLTGIPVGEIRLSYGSISNSSSGGYLYPLIIGQLRCWVYLSYSVCCSAWRVMRSVKAVLVTAKITRDVFSWLIKVKVDHINIINLFNISLLAVLI